MNPDTSSKLASELRRLVSPEKAQYLLWKLVDSNPSLWVDLQQILDPEHSSTSSPTFPVHRNQHLEDDQESLMPQSAVNSVLRRLQSLQLSELPLDTLGIVTSFLSLRDSLRWSGTDSFFLRSIPKYIASMELEDDITRSVYDLLFKAERLRALSINGWRRPLDEKLPFLMSMNRLKSVETMSFKNVHFVANRLEQHRFEGGTYSVRDLDITSCANLDRSEWLQMTARSHSPDLETVRIVLDDEPLAMDRVDREEGPLRERSVHDFVVDLVRSTEHRQIRNLALSVHGDDILSAMRMNPMLIGNLKKLELGLMDRHCHHDHSTDIAANFRRLFSRNAERAVFGNLEMLLIDFCPNAHGGVFNDVSPSDLSEFSASIPAVFPALKLLALYGSRSKLMFGDEHLRGLLDGHCVEQIVDLSLGFEHLSDHLVDRLVPDILATFRNVAWLTLQSQEFLVGAGRHRFEHSLQSTVDVRHHNLEWVTLCGAECDEIRSLSNGVYVEYWDRGIAQCQFNEALARSQEIVRKRHHVRLHLTQSVSEMDEKMEEREVGWCNLEDSNI